MNQSPRTEATLLAKQMSMMIKIYRHMYKVGVLDAAELNDEAVCIEMIEECDNNPYFFGRVIFREGMRWERFLLEITGIFIDNDMPFTNLPIDTIRSTKSLYFPCLQIAMKFYMKGVKDYTEDPDRSRLRWFKKQKNASWVKGVTLSQNKQIRSAKLVALKLTYTLEKDCLDYDKKHPNKEGKPNYKSYRSLLQLHYNS